MNRRQFLKAAVLGAVLIFGNPVFSRADLVKEAEEAEENDVIAEEDGVVNDAVNDVISDVKKEARLLLYNTHTGERLDAVYRKPTGEYDIAALAGINNILRCHYTNKTTEMDVRVLDFINAVDNAFGGGNEIHVISGFRSPEYNKLLRRRNRRVARHSLHLHGMAIDLRIPGVPLKKIKRVALDMKCGGVGYYPRKGFVHLDSGRFRHW